MNSVFNFISQELCRKGCFIEIYGDSGSANEQLLMSIAKEAMLSNIFSLYIDSTGRFRPERILQMAHEDDLSILKGLDFLSAPDSAGLVDRISKILSLNKYELIIWDGLVYPFYETSSSHKLGLISRLLSVYSFSGHKVIASDPLVGITGLPAGHLYTDPYVHLRAFLKIEGNRLFIEGVGFKKEYFVTSNGVFLA
ncbi:MAG: hypothetical protein JRN26_01220 [Nitrososphaerota archaeon]|jgi:hypothetical protein|nr:hypothetical protein [Nitrososphaerota archaeon]MDG6928153.1 hypothetical protein [Nitrososphaerota archaeon]MDG6930075.1 hypothetical protein [Nitrososphaerota archaeon]MDG6932816.1 hypothetical protein [Nitrososphaerota archaeon]MDG6935500.1 hypothetical protein [Nitrososphaerota archaeon]